MGQGFTKWVCGQNDSSILQTGLVSTMLSFDFDFRVYAQLLVETTFYSPMS